MGTSLVVVFGRCRDAQPLAQPTPQRRRNQQLLAPPPQTRPVVAIRASSEAGADLTRRLTQNQVAIQRFDNDGRGVPSPRMQPIRQPTYRPLTTPTPITAHPDDDPTF